MKIFPAIDLYGHKAVRLYKGNYSEMTVYSNDPLSVAADFIRQGADCIHLVDLEGARDGTTPHIDIISEIAEKTGMLVEVGGGIRNMDVLDKYMGAGIGRAILGTAAVTDEPFLRAAVEKYGNRIATGADIKDGCVAIKGWIEKTELSADAFFAKMQDFGIGTVVCTDVSRDGAMRGTNLELYRTLAQKYSVNIVASGGVSTMEDIRALKAMNIYGAIIGKAYYSGALDLAEVIKYVNDN